ncbi:MAG: hypothetical protein HYS12_09695 [Planctomycetes bacterium]|nr:hypothetical protein [Planctomycetota bacterium]
MSQQNLLAEARGEIAQGLIQVYRALGGGWQIRDSGCEEACPGSSPPMEGKAQTSPDTVVPHAMVSPAEVPQGTGGWR